MEKIRVTPDGLDFENKKKGGGFKLRSPLMPNLFLRQSRVHLRNHSEFIGEIHTAGLGVIASKLWNSGSSKHGDFKTIYAPLFLYLSSVAFKTT